MGDLAAADFIEASDLGQKLGDFRAAVLGKELHQRAGQFIGGDRKLLDGAGDGGDGGLAVGEGLDHLDPMGVGKIEECRCQEGGVEVVAPAQGFGDQVVHLGRAGEGAKVSTARDDMGVTGQGPVNLAGIHLKELGQHDVGEVGACRQRCAGGNVVAGDDVEHGLVGKLGRRF